MTERKRKRWSISFRWRTEGYDESIVWCVTPYGELAEILNEMLAKDDIIEFVCITEITEVE